MKLESYCSILITVDFSFRWKDWWTSAVHPVVFLFDRTVPRNIVGPTKASNGLWRVKAINRSKLDSRENKM